MRAVMLDKERERQLEMERNQLQALTKARADRKDEVAVTVGRPVPASSLT